MTPTPPQLQGPVPQMDAGQVYVPNPSDEAQRLGNVMGNAAKSMRDAATRQEAEAKLLQDEVDEAQARKGLVDLGQFQSSAMLDPKNGYLWSQGEQALARRPGVLSDWQARVASIEEGLGSRMARTLFRQQAELRSVELLQRVDAHAGKEVRQHTIETTQLALDQHIQEAVEAYGLPGPNGKVNGIYDNRRGLALLAFDRLAEAKGMSKTSPEYDILRKQVAGALATGVINKLADQSPAQAQAYMMGLDPDELPPQVRATLSAKIQDEADLRIGVQQARYALKGNGGNVELAAEALSTMFTAQGRGMSDKAYRSAQRELQTVAEQRKAVGNETKVMAFERAKAWLMQNPGATDEDLPSEHATAIDQTFQRDDVRGWLSDGKTVVTNLALKAQLEAASPAWFRAQDPNDFRARYIAKLAEKDMTHYLGRIQVGQGSGTSQQKADGLQHEMDRVAASQGGVLAAGSIDKQDAAAEMKFVQFQNRVNELDEARAEEIKDPKRRRQAARIEALTEKDGGKYYWEMTAEERKGATIQTDVGPVPIERIREDSTFDEKWEAVQALTGDGLNEAVFALESERLRGKGLLPDAQVALARQMALERNLNGLDPIIVAKEIARRRRERGMGQEQARRLTPGYVSWSTLRRQGLVSDPQDITEPDKLFALGLGRADVAVSVTSQKTSGGRLGIGIVSTELRGAKDRLEIEGGTAGLSIAAALRLAELGGKRGWQGRIYSQGERAESLKRFDEAASAREAFDAEAEPEEIAKLESQIANLEKNAGPGHIGTQFAKARLSAMKHHQATGKQTTPALSALADEAWEAWLQDGGEVFELSLDQPFVGPRPAESLTPGVWTGAASGSRETHEAMRKRVVRWKQVR